MADVEGVQIRITGDSSHAVREFAKLKEAAEKINQIKIKPKLDWDAQHIQVDLSKLKIPANIGRSFANEMSNGINQVASGLESLGTRVSTTFGNVFNQIRYGLLSVIGSAGLLTNEFRKSLAIGGGFESTMTSVQVVSGATSEELGQLTAKAREMGATLPITAQQAGQAMLIMAQRGTEFADILTTVEDVSNLSISQGTDMATAAELLGSTMTQFSISTDNASKVVDVFNNACNDSPLNMTRLVDSMKYVGPVAGSMGVKLEEAVSALEALHASGLTGEMAGTGLRSIFQKLASKAQIAGVETKNLDGSLRSLSEIFGELQSKGYSVAEATKDFGARGANAALGLMKLSSSLEGYEERLQRAGATNSAVQEKMKSWPNVWNAFQSATEELHIEIFDQIKEQAKYAVSSIADLTRAFSKWVGETEIAKKALDAFLEGLGFKIPTFESFKRMLDNFNFDEFISTVKSLGSSIRGIGESIVSFFETVKTPLLFLIEHLGTFATISFWGWITGNAMSITGGLMNIAGGFSKLAGAFSTVEGAAATLSGIMPLLAGGAIIGGGATIIHQISNIYDEIFHADEKLADFEADLNKRFPPVDVINSKLVLAVTTDFKTGYEELPNEFELASLNVQDAIKNRMEKLKENFTELFLDVYNDLNVNAKQPLKKISDNLGTALTAALNGSEEAYKSLQPEMQKTIDLLKETGVKVDKTSQSFKDSLASFKNIEHLKSLKFEDTDIPLTKIQGLYKSVSDTIDEIINEFPDKVSEIDSILGHKDINIPVELQLDAARESFEAFIKKASKDSGISKGIISAEVFNRLKELAAQGNATAQSLAIGWEDSGKGFDDFLQKANDYVSYMGAAPEKFTPALGKMANGIQKIDPLTGKVTEQFKKAYNALKEWANVSFDKVSQRIQKLKKAVEGGFLKKESLEAEYKKVSSQVKAQIIMELEPEKKNYSQSQYRSVLASEYQSRMSDLGGESFVEMMKKEFGKISGEAMGAIIERTAQRMTIKSPNYTQAVKVEGQSIQQTPNIQSFAQALNPIVSNLQQITAQKQSSPVIDYSNNIATIISELKNTSVNIQNVKVAVDNMSTNMASNFTTLSEAIRNSAGGNNVNVEINQTGFTVENKSDADNVARITASAIRQGLGNGGI